MEHEVAKPEVLVLPLQVTGLVDVGRLLRELEMLDNALLQLGLRKGDEEVKMPKTSRLMDHLIAENHLNLLQQVDRDKLKKFLETVRQHSPIIHMSFSADPNPAFNEKIMAYLRSEIHPLVLVTIGLQPNIGAGCVMQTTNKFFDMSLKKDFEGKRELLLSSIHGVPQAEVAA